MPRLLIVILLFMLALPAHARAADLETMVGQMLMAGFRGYTINDESPIARDIRERHLGGVILFDYDVALGKPERNIKSPAQVQTLIETLQTHATTPLLVGVDQEGGRVQRLKAKYGFTETPSASDLGSAGDAACTTAADTIAQQLRGLGFNVDFAPVADVNVDPNSPAIGAIGRSFSPDPEQVAHDCALFLDAFRARGLIGSLKHFPGHGSAGADSHLGLTDVTNTWSDKELVPYRRLADKARMIMTAHIFNEHLDPKYPATLSRAIITGILREDIGFKGVVITDDMNMKAITSHFGQAEAIRLAIEAGADILLFGNNLVYDPDIVRTAHALIVNMVKDGTIPLSRIKQSYERIMALKKSI